MSDRTESSPTWDKDRAAELLRALRAGASLEDAAAFAGLTPEDLRAWVEAGTADPKGPFGGLLASIRKARADLRVANLAQLTKAAQAGNVSAARFLLEKAGQDGGPANRGRSAVPPGTIPGKTLCDQLRRGAISASDLSKDARKQCVLWLENRGMTRANMAAFLGVSDRQLLYDLKELGQEAMDHGFDIAVVLGWIYRVVDNIQAQARRLALKAERAGDYSAAASALSRRWQAIKEHIEGLQSMGILPKAADRMQIDVRVEERVKVIYGIVVHAVLAEVPDPDTRRRIEERVTRELGEALV